MQFKRHLIPSVPYAQNHDELNLCYEWTSTHSYPPDKSIPFWRQPIPFFMMTTSSSDQQQRLELFLQWFRELEHSDQEELMTLVYGEHKVRDVVRTFSSMPVDQRKAVFQRLGLPNGMLNRIPPPSAVPNGEIEVEWQEWDNTNSV